MWWLSLLSLDTFSIFTRDANCWRPKRVQIKAKKQWFLLKKSASQNFFMRTVYAACALALRHKIRHSKRKVCHFVTLFLGLITLLPKLPTTDVQSDWKLTPKKSSLLRIPFEVKRSVFYTKSVQVGNPDPYWPIRKLFNLCQRNIKLFKFRFFQLKKGQNWKQLIFT